MILPEPMHQYGWIDRYGWESIKPYCESVAKCREHDLIDAERSGYALPAEAMLVGESDSTPLFVHVNDHHSDDGPLRIIRFQPFKPFSFVTGHIFASLHELACCALDSRNSLELVLDISRCTPVLRFGEFGDVPEVFNKAVKEWLGAAKEAQP